MVLHTKVSSMRLLKCVACGHEVSDQALACPSCGQPIGAREDTVQTIQLTKKKWKKVHIIAVLFFIAGLFFMNGETWGLGVFFWVASFVTAFVARIGAWWSTG